MESRRKLLPVREGERGLRQSDAVFLHIKQFPPLLESLPSPLTPQAVGVSVRPRSVEDSYMPCFKTGEAIARSIAHSCGCPLYEFSHQQGHIAAALWSAGRLDLMQTPHLAWHLSGGTTELLYVEPIKNNVQAARIGGSSDISAGQIMDRTGKMLQLNFPAGRALDELSRSSLCNEFFRVKTSELTFSLSGLENKVLQFHQSADAPEDVARYAVLSVCDVVMRTTLEAMRQYPGLPILFSGGVASNSLLREKCKELDSVFAQPAFSTDNAMGIAVLTWLQEVGA